MYWCDGICGGGGGDSSSSSSVGGGGGNELSFSVTEYGRQAVGTYLSVLTLLIISFVHMLRTAVMRHLMTDMFWEMRH